MGKKIINSGIFVKGVTKGAEDDFYGVIKHIYEVEYNTLSHCKKGVVFYCDWFDPSRNGTRVDPKYNTVEIRMKIAEGASDLGPIKTHPPATFSHTSKSSLLSI